jgi:hypothetical protein
MLTVAVLSNQGLIIRIQGRSASLTISYDVADNEASPVDVHGPTDVPEAVENG